MNRQLASIKNRLVEILNTEWDPIGIGGNPHLQDEYERYANLLIPLLENRATTESEVYDFLHSIEVSKIGLEVPDDVRKAVVAKLCSLAFREKERDTET